MKKTIRLITAVSILFCLGWSAGWLQDQGANNLQVGAVVSTLQETEPTIQTGTCGTNPIVSPDSSDFAGSIQIGSGSITSCKMLFNKTRTGRTVCVATDKTNKIALQVTTDTSSMVVSSAASMALDSINYICVENR